MKRLSKDLVSLVLFLLASLLLEAQVYVRDSADVPKDGSLLIRNEKALHFIVMGDWGRNGADHQREVADQMGKTATAINSQFVIATGDNFYPSGVISEWDPLWRYSFEDIYTDFHLQWDWYEKVHYQPEEELVDFEFETLCYDMITMIPKCHYASKPYCYTYTLLAN